VPLSIAFVLVLGRVREVAVRRGVEGIDPDRFAERGPRRREVALHDVRASGRREEGRVLDVVGRDPIDRADRAIRIARVDRRPRDP
jgi:hypothetical protein